MLVSAIAAVSRTNGVALMVRRLKVVALETESKGDKTRQSEEACSYEGESNEQQCPDISRRANMTSVCMRRAKHFRGE